MGGRLYRQLGTYAVVLLGAIPALASERNAGDKRRSPAVAGRVALCVVFLVIFVFVLCKAAKSSALFGGNVCTATSAARRYFLHWCKCF